MVQYEHEGNFEAYDLDRHNQNKPEHLGCYHHGTCQNAENLGTGNDGSESEGTEKPEESVEWNRRVLADFALPSISWTGAYYMSLTGNLSRKGEILCSSWSLGTHLRIQVP